MTVPTQTMRTLIVVALSLPAILGGQSSVPQAAVASSNYGHAVPVPTAVAARRVSPITLDARLDEEAWKTATPITEFAPEHSASKAYRQLARELVDRGAVA